MNVQIVWNSGFDLIEKLAKLLGTMASIALADDPSGCDVESGKTAMWCRGACNRDCGAPLGQVAWVASAGCGPGPGSATSHRRTARWRARAEPRRGRRHREPWRRNQDRLRA